MSILRRCIVLTINVYITVYDKNLRLFVLEIWPSYHRTGKYVYNYNEVWDSIESRNFKVGWNFEQRIANDTIT